MKQFAFKVGPLEPATRESAYFIYPGTPDHQVSMAPDDVSGLRDLLQWYKGGVLVCEPQLRTAAEQLGLECESYDVERAHALGMVSFDLVLAERLAQVEPQEIVYAYGTACAEYFRAASWNYAFAGRTVGLLITGSVKRRVEARILGPQGEQKGLVLFEPDSLSSLSQKTDAKEIVEALLRVGAIGCDFSDEPAYAVDAMRRAYGLDSFPAPIKLVAGKTEPLSSEDLLALSVALRAISALRDPAEETSAEVSVGKLNVAAIAWVA
jgi:hypothetical protein